MPTSFAVERTLGRLGKWLRLMGFDAILESDYPQGTFEGPIIKDRIFLTRTRRVFRSRSGLKSVLVVANDPFEQLAAIIRQLDLRPEDMKPFSRCLRCNQPIVSVSKESVLGVVPDYVWETTSIFSRCLRCGRVYWPGSHTSRSLEKLNTIFELAHGISPPRHRA